MSETGQSDLPPEEVIEGDDVFLDTSVLLNHAHIEIEGNRGSKELLSCEAFNKTVGSTVEAELEDRLEVRQQVYRDLSTYLKQNRESHSSDLHIVYQYDPYSREELTELSLTKNDVKHIRRLQQHLAEECDRPQYKLRKYNRYLKKAFEAYTDQFESFPNEGEVDLAKNIGKRIDNYSDGKVLSQAVKWKRVRINNQGLEVEAVVSGDKDMYENVDEINEEIRKKYSKYSELSIHNLSVFSSE